jgi:hypothetical protein
MKLLVGFLIAVAASVGLLFFIGPREIAIGKPSAPFDIGILTGSSSTPEVLGATTTPSSTTSTPRAFVDTESDHPLANPPPVIKAVYLTGWSAGSSNKINYVKKLAAETEINAVVIDVKDYSGELSYRATIPEVIDSGAGEVPKISRPNSLLKELHGAGIYVIGRISVFQDPVLSKAHPEWALKQGSTTAVWKDQKGLAWMDAAAKPVWDYNIAIAKDILARGFDEVNFDYVRFPSDGDTGKISYPYWNKKTSRHKIIGEFFKYVRSQLPEARLSADLFGLATVNSDDLGIGQVIEDAYRYFDYVAPMVYPSHYASGFLGYKNPANYPYEVVKYSMEIAIKKLKAFEASSTAAAASSSSGATLSNRPPAQLRPWFQDFNLGATYDAAMVRKQITALDDAASGTTALVNGWMMWNPSNNYTTGAFRPKNQ